MNTEENDILFLHAGDLSLETLRAIRKDLEPVARFRAYRDHVETLDWAIQKLETTP